MPSRALVVGGGIGGMAAAIALLHRGVAVDLVDIDADWRAYGAGITITGPTLRAFRDLGVLDTIAAAGFMTEAAHMYRYDDTLLTKMAAPAIEPGLPSSGGIMRPVLHHILSEAVRAAGADVGLGVSVAELDDEGSGVAVTFTDGAAARYDLVIGADGIGSRLRRRLFPGAAEPAYTGQMSWRVVAGRPAKLDVAQFYFGHRHIAGVIPCSGTEVYAFVLNPAPEPMRVADEDQPKVLRDLLADFGGDIGRIRDGIDDHSEIVHRPFLSLLQPRPWHSGRTVLIGDAVHATTAHLASGAGLAVEDAIVLAQELDRNSSVETALVAFERRRFERCRLVVETGIAIGRSQLANAPPPEIGAMMAKAMEALAQPA